MLPETRFQNLYKYLYIHIEVNKDNVLFEEYALIYALQNKNCKLFTAYKDKYHFILHNFVALYRKNENENK